MLWLILSFATGLVVGAQGAVSKRLMEKHTHLMPAFAASAFALPFYAAVLLWRGEAFPHPPPIFYLYLLVTAAILYIATLTYFKAIQQGELSRDLPLTALTPIFMMITSKIIVGQSLSSGGALAIITIVAGSFILQSKAKISLRETVQNIFREPGSRLMLIVAVLWSITANFDKLGVNLAGPIWYSACFHLLLTCFYLPRLLANRHQVSSSLKSGFWGFLVIGALGALFMLIQMTAVDLAPHVGYVIALKRGGIVIFGILIGVTLFKERQQGRRVLGGLLIGLGLYLLTGEAG